VLPKIIYPTMAFGWVPEDDLCNGAIYAHEGKGKSFAKFTIATSTWKTWVQLPTMDLNGSNRIFFLTPIGKRYMLMETIVAFSSL
jgi:hypothetical protein